MVSYKQFSELLLPIPSSDEQQKIADCLSSLDELIAAQSQKLEHLQAHKKGLMRQLFPAEGETVPKLRFPEFQGGLEWEESQLGEYFTHIRNGFVGTATPYYVPNGIPYLQGKNIKQGRINSKELVTISNDFHQKQQKSQSRINDILMVQSGHVGECALVNEKFAGSNCHALIIMSPKTHISPDFFIHYFHSESGRSRIDNIKTGNTIEHILSSGLKSLKVDVPKLAEQQRIAECLSPIDEVIAAQKQKIEFLKVHKKGLMQQLFPSPDEVRG